MGVVGLPRKYAFPVCCLAALLAAAAPRPAAAAQYVDAPIEFARYPFLPELTVNEEPAVCERFLANVTEQFKSTNFYFFALDGSQSFDMVPWEDRWNNSELAAIEADVDGDGDLDLLLLGTYSSPSSGHDIYSTLAIDDRNGFVLRADSNSSRQVLKELKSEYSAKAAHGPGGIGKIHIFSFNGGVYAFQSPYWSDLPLSIYRTSLDTAWKEVCRVVVFPHTFVGPEGRIPTVASLPDIVGPAMRGFLVLRRATLGFTECGGTMHSDYKNKRRNTASLRNIYFRPWTSFPREPDTNETRYAFGLALLEEWAHTGFWEARTYREILAKQVNAASDLSGWYEEQFGVSAHDAQRMAERLVWELVGGNLVVSQYFKSQYLGAGGAPPDWREGLRRLRNGETLHPLELQAWFLRALIDADAADVARFLDAGASASHVTNPNKIYYRTEPPFFLAIDRPEILALLLERGADPDQSNDFGKTPLMYTAHFNLPESAEILLRHGADPDLRTGQMKRGCGSLRYTKRTALMYAAENADQRMMALLIEAGADKTARDFSGRSRPGRSIADYLALNEKLTEAQRAEIIGRWGLE